MGIIRRFDLLRAYCSRDREFDFPWGDLPRNLLRPPCTLLAKSHIEGMAEVGGYKRVRLRDIERPLYWPSSIPLYGLYMVIAESLDERNWHYYEVPETRVERGDVVLDCGAAEGLFSLKLAGRAECILVEPAAAFAESLKRTFDGIRNVRIAPVALGSRAGRGCLSAGRLNSALNDAPPGALPGDAVFVRTTTIDELVAEMGLKKIDYIKGDLESFELEVLKGAERTIRDYMPKIAMTTYHPGNDWKEMRDYVLSLAPGYAWRVKGLSWSNEGPKPVMIHFWRPGRR
jgi:FkbM family methyltransferase